MARESIEDISKEIGEALKQMEGEKMPEKETLKPAGSGEPKEELKRRGRSERRNAPVWRQPSEMEEQDIEEEPEAKSEPKSEPKREPEAEKVSKEKRTHRERRKMREEQDALIEDVSTQKQEAATAEYRSRRGERPELFRPSDGLVAAFFVPVIILVVIFAQRGIFPFGQESFLRTDMYHQYAPFFSEFQDKLTHGGSLLYSWNIGLGVNFSALYAYYLASPLNWLLLLCPKALIIEFMTYSIVLKTGLCGLTFAWYLRKHNNSSDFGVAFFGIFYALSGYMAAYSWNIMWLDCILLFPLIMLGVERLVTQKKGMFYCIMLGLSILSNYYISIMICVFMVMYFVCLLILQGRQSIKDFFIRLGQFGAYSLIAGGLAAMVLLPEIYALQSTASGNVSFPKTLEMYFPIIDMLARHIGNVQTETGLNHWPNIYCGVAVYMFFLLYLACKKIPVKEKAVTCGLLLMFFASFSVNALNFMWHGFHYPNSLPCRQSFIYIFLMLSLCYRAYLYLPETPKKHIAVAFWGSICFVLLAQKLVTNKAYHFSAFYVAILFLALYVGLIYLYKNPRRSRTTVALLALTVVAVEAAINMTVTSITTTSRTAYKADNADVRELTKNLGTDNGFYRIEKVDRKTKNDGAWMNFPSVSLFSSVAHADLGSFFKKIGCESSTNAYSITGGTPLVDSLLSIRYALYDGAQENPALILHGTSGDTYLYENPDILPLGFLMPEGMEEKWQTDLANPADVQNSLAAAVGAPDVLSEVLVEGEGTSFSFVPEKDGEYYVYILNKKVKSVTVSKGEDSENFDNINRGYLLEIGFCSAGETVVINNKEDSEELKPKAYVFEPEGLKKIYEVLNQTPFDLIKWDEDKLEGVIEANGAGTMFLSVPYDKGWNVKVDGVPVSPRKLLDAFMAVDLTEGRHSITMNYVPEGLKSGAIISAASVGLLILLAAAVYLRGKRKDKSEPDPYEQLDEEWQGVNRKEENK